MRPGEFWVVARWLLLRVALPVLVTVALLIWLGYILGRR